MDQDMQETKRKERRTKKQIGTGTLILSLLLVIAVAVGGTLAWLYMRSNSIKNTFTPARVACAVDESFDGDTKSKVTVINTGDTDAYVRVKLVSYRVNAAGDRIGGVATIPTFTVGSGWTALDGYYYYGSPIAPEQITPNLLGNNTVMYLTTYSDADGGRQVVEVMAEAIQALGTDGNGKTPTQLAWAVTIDEFGNVSPYTGG